MGVGLRARGPANGRSERSRTRVQAPAERRVASAVLAVVAASLLAALAASPVEARNAYVANANDNDVGVIDTTTDTNLGTLISVDLRPRSVAITPSGERAYVANTIGDSVSVIDTATNSKIGTDIAVGAEPSAIAITPDGARAYVVNLDDGDVSVIDTTTNSKIGTDIPVGSQPGAIAITPDGKSAYVVNNDSDEVSVIDTATNANLNSDIAVGDLPFAIAITPDGKRAYVANAGDNDVSVIDTAANVNLGIDIAVGLFPTEVAVTPDGKTAYVVNNDSDEVSVIDTATNTTLPTGIAVGGEDPIAAAITPDGKRVYVVNGAFESAPFEVPGSVSVISTATNTIDPADDILVGNNPLGIAITPNQPPQAALSASRDATAAANGEKFTAEVGESVSFDGSASADPDGEIATYAWDFGDGEQVADGPAQTHAYTAPGTYTATLKLTDDEGCSTEFVFTGQTASCNGSDVAEASQKVKVLGAPKLKLRAKSKQKPDALKLKASCGELPCEAKLSGKAKLPRKGKKAKSYKLKTKTVSVKEGKTKTVKLKFKNQSRSVKKISKLLKKDNEARKRNKLVVKVKATGPAGGTDKDKQKIKLER